MKDENKLNTIIENISSTLFNWKDEPGARYWGKERTQAQARKIYVNLCRDIPDLHTWATEYPTKEPTP